RLGPSFGDAVVADHRRREAHELLGEARIGDHFLVTRHRGREHRLADGEALRPDRVAAEDRAVLERKKAGHVAYASRPAAIVARTFPLTVSPSSHEFTERDR